METIVSSLKVLFRAAAVIYAMYSGIDADSPNSLEKMNSFSSEKMSIPTKMQIRTIDANDQFIKINHIELDSNFQDIKSYKKMELINADANRIIPFNQCNYGNRVSSLPIIIRVS